MATFVGTVTRVPRRHVDRRATGHPVHLPGLPTSDERPLGRYLREGGERSVRDGSDWLRPTERISRRDVDGGAACDAIDVAVRTNDERPIDERAVAGRYRTKVRARVERAVGRMNTAIVGCRVGIGRGPDLDCKVQMWTSERPSHGSDLIPSAHRVTRCPAGVIGPF